MTPNFCELCGKKLIVRLEGKGTHNPVTGIQEFWGGYICPDRSSSWFGIGSNGHSYFRGTYKYMGEHFDPFIFDENKNRIEK